MSFGSVGSETACRRPPSYRALDGFDHGIDGGTRLFVGSGEKNTRTVVLPILTG